MFGGLDPFSNISEQSNFQFGPHYWSLCNINFQPEILKFPDIHVDLITDGIRVQNDNDSIYIYLSRNDHS